MALIAGPTASGKSDVAVKIALRLAEHGRRAVIINADSAQVYRDLAILSARPTAQEMQGIEHWLFGEWDGAIACSAAAWAARARDAITAAHAQQALPILVGGTGLYLRTLVEGIAPMPAIDPEIRRQVRAMAVAEAHAALLREDPERAAALAPTDAARIARALEVVRSTGRTLSQWQARRSGGIADAVTIRAAILLPDRKALYERCNRRFRAMIERGAVAEVQALLARRLDPGLPVMRAIGVREIAGYLDARWSLKEAELRASQATRNYAKRQFTWFRHQPPPEWLRLSYDDFNMDRVSEILFRKLGLT